jgi:hypothetical protein
MRKILKAPKKVPIAFIITFLFTGFLSSFYRQMPWRQELRNCEAFSTELASPLVAHVCMRKVEFTFPSAFIFLAPLVLPPLCLSFRFFPVLVKEKCKLGG